MRLPCIYRGLPPRTHLQHALQEKLLQLLVGRVDEQLLEGVGLEELEAKGVEQPDGRRRCDHLDAALAAELGVRRVAHAALAAAHLVRSVAR